MRCMHSTPKLNAAERRQAGGERHADRSTAHVVLAVLLQHVQRPVHQRRQDAAPLRQRSGQGHLGLHEQGLHVEVLRSKRHHAASDLDGYLLFNQGLGASELGIVNGLGQARAATSRTTRRRSRRRRRRRRHARCPAEHHGLDHCHRGLGRRCLRKNQEAAVSFLKFATGPVYQPQMLTEVAGPGTLLPPSRLSVLTDPSRPGQVPVDGGSRQAGPGPAPVARRALPGHRQGVRQLGSRTCTKARGRRRRPTTRPSRPRRTSSRSGCRRRQLTPQLRSGGVDAVGPARCCPAREEESPSTDATRPAPAPGLFQ